MEVSLGFIEEAGNKGKMGGNVGCEIVVAGMLEWLEPLRGVGGEFLDGGVG